MLITSEGEPKGYFHQTFSEENHIIHATKKQQTLVRDKLVQAVVEKYKQAINSANLMRESLSASQSPQANVKEGSSSKVTAKFFKAEKILAHDLPEVPSHLTEDSLIRDQEISEEDLSFMAAVSINQNAHEETEIGTFGQLVRNIVEKVTDNPPSDEIESLTQEELETGVRDLLKEDLIAQGYCTVDSDIIDEALIIDYTGEIMNVKVNSGGALVISESMGDSAWNPSIRGHYKQDTYLLRAQNLKRMESTGVGRYHLTLFNKNDLEGKHPQDVRQLIQDMTGARLPKYAQKISEMDPKSYQDYVEENPLVICQAAAGASTRLNYGLNYKQGVASPLQASGYFPRENYSIINQGNIFPCLDEGGQLSYLELDYNNPREQLMVKGVSCPTKALVAELATTTTIERVVFEAALSAAEAAEAAESGMRAL